MALIWIVTIWQLDLHWPSNPMRRNGDRIPTSLRFAPLPRRATVLVHYCNSVHTTRLIIKSELLVFYLYTGNSELSFLASDTTAETVVVHYRTTALLAA